MVLILQLICLMLSLVAIGEPLRIIFSQYSNIFKNLDLLQVTVLNVYLGGFILYVIALVPFGFFSSNILLGITLFSILFILIFYAKKFHSLPKERLKLPNKRSVICQAVVLSVFLIMLWITTVPTASFIFGNVNDSSLYSLFAKVILENRQVPQTLQPYSPEGIIYPQGFFVVSAFANILPLNFSLAETPLLVTPLFQSLSVLGAYYLGKALSGRKLGMSFAFVFAFVSRWPLLLVWGSNAFVFGFPLYFISLSFIPHLQNFKFWNKTLAIEFIAIGLLYGYLAAAHFTLYSVLILSAIIWFLQSLLHRQEFLELIRLKLRPLFIIVIVSLLVFGVFVFRALIWYSYPGHNLGLPTDISIQPYPQFNTVGWLLYSEGISPSQILTVETLIIISISIGALFYDWYFRKVEKGVKVALVSLIGASVLFAIGSLDEIFPPLALFAAEPVRSIILLLVSLCFLIGIFNVDIYRRVRNTIQTKFSFRFPTKKIRSFNVAAILSVIVIISSIYIPYISYTFNNDVSYMTGQYNLFCVTSQDDLKLMQWMSENMPKDSLVLVNPYDAGGFIPVVSNNPIIYPFVSSRNSQTYQTLIKLINQNMLNSTTFRLMKLLNITNIFVGSGATYGQPTWDPTLYLGNPNFALVKNIGKSYLFKCLYTDPSTFFSDDFEYSDIRDNGWLYYVPLELSNNGTGFASVSSNNAAHGLQSLMMMAQKTKGPYYTNWIYRHLYVPEKSNTTISFFMNATISSSFDFVAMIVSDNSWNNKILFATPNVQPNKQMVKLNSTVGFFEFNLSQLWNERFHSALPSSIYLEAQITDLDGIKDIGFIDNLTMRSAG